MRQVRVVFAPSAAFAALTVVMLAGCSATGAPVAFDREATDADALPSYVEDRDGESRYIGEWNGAGIYLTAPDGQTCITITSQEKWLSTACGGGGDLQMDSGASGSFLYSTSSPDSSWTLIADDVYARD